MAGDAIFRVAADVAEFVAGMARAEQATKKVARSAGNIGDQVGASVVKIELLNRALNAAGRAISGVMDKASSASQNAGDRAIGLATSLGSLGVRDINSTIKRLSGGSGGTTAEQKANFAKALASANKQRRTPLSGDEADAALQAFAELGEFGFGEGGADLLEGLSNGQSLADITAAGRGRFERIQAARTDPMSPLFQGLRGRGAEAEAQRAEEDAFLVSGTSERAQKAAMRVRAASDPGGPVSIINGAVGDTAATVLNRGLNATTGDDPAARATENAARATVQMNENFRRLLNRPNFATDTQ